MKTGSTATLIVESPDSAVPEEPLWTVERVLDENFLPANPANSGHRDM